MRGAAMRQVHEELRAALRARGLRATPSRIAVLELVRAAATPPTFLDVLQQLGAKARDRATIHRNLSDLVSTGLLRRIDMGDHLWRFDTLDSRHSKHPHFTCSACARVECLRTVELVVRRGATTRRALQTQEVEIRVRGRCDACS
jgi:Fur family ferric uptake transcriptional regulator